MGMPRWQNMFVATAALLGLASRMRAQEGRREPPMTYPVLTALVLNKVPESRIQAIVSQRGCTFSLSAAQGESLRDLGASRALLQVVATRCGAVKPSRPPAQLGTGFGAEQFARIDAGRFQMGSASGDDDERPVRTVTLTRPFLLQKTEVTQGQWQAVMGRNPSEFTACGPRCPVEQVSWDDIQQFLARLNARDPGKGYRLPTEAEWEYAARAGTTGDYGGTGGLDEMGWYLGNSGGTTHPAAQKRPNAWGLYDLHGNVAEWVADWYGPYPGASTTDPRGAGDGDGRVLRGGSWDSAPVVARSAYRVRSAPGERGGIGGFRLARTP